MSATEREDTFLDYAGASQYLEEIGCGKYSPDLVYRMAKDGILPFVKRPGLRGRIISKAVLRRHFDRLQAEAEREVLQTGTRRSARR